MQGQLADSHRLQNIAGQHQGLHLVPPCTQDNASDHQGAPAPACLKEAVSCAASVLVPPTRWMERKQLCLVHHVYQGQSMLTWHRIAHLVVWPAAQPEQAQQHAL